MQVSLEGPEDVHELIRGRGSFAQAVWGVKNLLDAGLTVTLNATLSRLNAHKMTDMVGIAWKTGVQRLGFSRLVPSGRGLSLINEMLQPAEVKDLYGTLLKIDVPGLEIVTGDPLAALLDKQEKGLPGCTAFGGCAAGISGLTILSDGTVTPCRRLHIPIGNVKRDNIREIWAGSKVLGALRDRKKYSGKCGECPRWASCRGCRAIAYAYSLSRGRKDFLGEDPQCFRGPVNKTVVNCHSFNTS